MVQEIPMGEWPVGAPKTLALRLEAEGAPAKICEDLVRVAGKLELRVYALVNGIMVVAKPGDSPARLFSVYQDLLHHDHHNAHKVAEL